MCVIMNSGPGIPPPPVEHIVNANDGNPDGWGVSINIPGDTRDNSSIVTIRGFSTEDLIKAISTLNGLRNNKSNLVIHCRIATGGTIDLSNTHPFAVNDSLYLFHNGIFPESLIPTTSNPKKPDSYHLAQVISPAVTDVPEWILSPIFSSWLDDLCTQGYPNKILLLDAYLGAVMYNQVAWVEGEEGRQYSNTGPLFSPYFYEEPISEKEPELCFAGSSSTYDPMGWGTWKDDQEDLFKDEWNPYGFHYEKAKSYG